MRHVHVASCPASGGNRPRRASFFENISRKKFFFLLLFFSFFSVCLSPPAGFRLFKKKNINNFREHLSIFFEKTRSPRPMLRCLQADAGRPDKGTTRHASLNQASKMPIDLEGN